jgi:glucosamine-6-phosphate deaminase
VGELVNKFKKPLADQGSGSTPVQSHVSEFGKKPLIELRAEKDTVRIFPNEGNALANEVARRISDNILENNSKCVPTVLGLATGNTPLDIYRELIRMHNDEGLDFSRVVTFNLDEYYGLEPTHVCSYHRFMWENLFDHINIQKENVHIPDGTVARQDLQKYCREYEQAIADAGGIDILLLGIGINGHVGFNEPSSKIGSRTRLITLDETTRRSALPDFGELKYVPKEAITMGVFTILEARQIFLLATGEHKARIIREAVEGRVNEKVVASQLQHRSGVLVFLDQAAASELTRVKTPWVFDGIDWSDNKLVLKAVCHLSEKIGKPIPQLEENDFLGNSLGGLVKARDLAGLKDFAANDLSRKIMGRNLLPSEKRILVFSPILTTT